MTADACPTTDELSAWLGGSAPEGEDAPLIAHIEVCGRCQDALDRLTSGQATFASGDMGQTYGAEPRCREAVELIRRIVAETRSRKTASQSLALQLIETDSIDDYQLLAELGHGGMGAMYRVRSRQRGGPFALKVLTSERFRHRSARDRFSQEIRHLQSLRHANLVEAIDSGEWRGLPYLVMEHLDGMNLARLVETVGPLSVADACEITRQAAEGLGALHDAGLIHRDVKPSNLMLTAGAIVKVLDLGLARLADPDEVSHELTRSGQVLGTLHYIAPEQLTDPRKIDARCDIYSLGASLFWLLTGHPPYSAPDYESPYQIMAGHAAGPLPDIAATRDDVPVGLAGAMSKMLAKEADERFSDMREVVRLIAPSVGGHGVERLVEEAIQPAVAASTARAEDVPLRIQLPVVVADDEGEPPRIHENPASGTKPRWRKPSMLLMVLAFVLGGIAVMYHLSRDETAPATFGLRPADRTGVGSPRNSRPAAAAARGDDETRRQVKTDPSVESLLDRSFRGPAPRGEIEPGSVDLPPGTALGPHALVAEPTPIEGVRMWTIETRLPRGTLTQCAFSSDGRCYAVGGSSGVIRVFDAAADRLAQLMVAGAEITGLDWSPAGPYLAAITIDGSITVWDAARARLLRRLKLGSAVGRVVRWSPDGRRIACGGRGTLVPVHDLTTNEVLRLEGIGDPVETLAWSPDGGDLAFGTYDGTIGVWHLASSQPLTLLRSSGEKVCTLAWHPTQPWLAVADDGLMVRVLDTTTKEVLTEYGGHANALHIGVRWTLDGTGLISNDGLSVRFWDLKSPEPIRRVLNPLALERPKHGGPVITQLAFAPDGQSWAVPVRFLGSIWRYDLATDESRMTPDGHTQVTGFANVAWSSDGRHLAVPRSGHGIRVFDTSTSQLTHVLSNRPNSEFGQIDWSPAGDKLAAVTTGQVVLWWRPDAQQPQHSPIEDVDLTACQWSPDGTRVAAGSRLEGRVMVYHVTHPKPHLVFHVGQGMVTDVVWSSDSSQLACACERTVTVIRPDADEAPGVFTFPELVWDIAWHPDDNRIAAITFNGGSVETIDLTTQQIVPLTKHPKLGKGIVWLSDGEYLASASHSELRLWSMAEHLLIWCAPSGRCGPSSLI